MASPSNPGPATESVRRQADRPLELKVDEARRRGDLLYAQRSAPPDGTTSRSSAVTPARPRRRPRARSTRSRRRPNPASRRRAVGDTEEVRAGPLVGSAVPAPRRPRAVAAGSHRFLTSRSSTGPTAGRAARKGRSTTPTARTRRPHAGRPGTRSRDQGETGSCVGFALADSVMRWQLVELRRLPPAERLSARFIWMASKEWSAQRIAGGPARR